MAVLKGKLFGNWAIVLRLTQDESILEKHELHLDKDHLVLLDQLRGGRTRTRFIEMLLEQYLDYDDL